MTRTEQSLRAIAWMQTWNNPPKNTIQYHYSRLKAIHGWTPGEVREEIKKLNQKKAA